MIFSYLLNMQSHPSWVCGLKLIDPCQDVSHVLSHPSWVCGLKQGIKICHKVTTISHTLRGCVD